MTASPRHNVDPLAGGPALCVGVEGREVAGPSDRHAYLQLLPVTDLGPGDPWAASRSPMHHVRPVAGHPHRQRPRSATDAIRTLF